MRTFTTFWPKRRTNFIQGQRNDITVVQVGLAFVGCRRRDLSVGEVKIVLLVSEYILCLVNLLNISGHFSYLRIKISRRRVPFPEFYFRFRLLINIYGGILFWFAGKRLADVLRHVLMMIFCFNLLCPNVPDMCSTEFISLISAVTSVRSVALEYQQPYPVDEYISQYALHLDARASLR